MISTTFKCWKVFKADAQNCSCLASMILLGKRSVAVKNHLNYERVCFMFFSGPTSCTQTDCKWLLPSHVANLTYRPLADMDFSSAKKRKKTFDSCLTADSSFPSMCVFSPTGASFTAPSSGSSVSTCKPSTSSALSTASSSKSSTTASPTQSEIDEFYFGLSQCGHKPALLSVVLPYSDSYCTDMSVNGRPLTYLFNKDHIAFTFAELQTMSEAVDVNISENDIELIEMQTRGQNKNKNWFLFRAGRITASKLKDVCVTDISKPSLSLLKAICYPLESAFKSAATEWGIAHEEAALTKYKQSYYDHRDVSVEQCGLVINSDYPFMGASPDGLVSCQCCGNGVVEIKCPYNFRSTDVMEYVSSRESCFTEGPEIQLKKDHRYYYQVQAQMHICEVEYCNFVVCTFPSGVPCIFLTRVNRDGQFWYGCKEKASRFFRVCVLPELLGKAYTRPRTGDSTDVPSS